MMDDNGISIAVIGGGSRWADCAALCLQKIGFDVHVYEQSRALREVGAGINVTPNATRVIHGLGLGDKLASLGVMPMAVHQSAGTTGAHYCARRSAPKSNVISVFRNINRTAPTYSICWLTRCRPNACISVTGLTGFSERGDKIEAQFENGARVIADALIGADGIHSIVQRQLFGATPPHFTGCAAYRAWCPPRKLKHLDLEVVLQITMGPGKHFVRYFVASMRLRQFRRDYRAGFWTKEF